MIRSAFMMAYSTLTNAKTIMNLGPNKSILGTVIRPDPVLLERKGGSEGELTFNGLLPGAGEQLDSQYDKKQDMLFSILLRGGGTAENGGGFSGKKRKASKDSSFGKVKENGGARKRKNEDGSWKNRKEEKHRFKFYD